MLEAKNRTLAAVEELVDATVPDKEAVVIVGNANPAVELIGLTSNRMITIFAKRNKTADRGLALIPRVVAACFVAYVGCDWHTVNDAVTTYGEELLHADRKRLNRTAAIGLDETSFIRFGLGNHTEYATTVADVENHQIIDMLPSREYKEVAKWIHKQPEAWKQRITTGVQKWRKRSIFVRISQGAPSPDRQFIVICSRDCYMNCYDKLLTSE